MQKILTIFFIFFTSLCFLNCGDDEAKPQYLLTIDGYRENFTGYYKINGAYVSDFIGEEKHSSYYYYETGLSWFDSIKIFAFKNSEKCSLTISIWKDNLEIASISSGENDGYNEQTGTYKLAVGPLYYEREIDDESTIDSEGNENEI
jgi:hypothetical protein